MNQRKNRTIYGRRQSRPLKETQKQLWNTIFERIQIKLEDLSRTFPNGFPQEIIFEIGFGSGENLAHQAKQNPNTLCIGCEPFINGIASLLTKIEKDNIKNIVIFDDDAKLLLQALPNKIISSAFILFPDPWPKKRHHRRRIVNIENLLLLHQKMNKNASLIIATDHPGYLEWILDITKQQILKLHFQIISTSTMSRPSEEEIPVTRYEKKALEDRPSAFLRLKAI